MWSKELGMTKVLFNTESNKKHSFTQGMWFEKLGITEVLFNT